MRLLFTFSLSRRGILLFVLSSVLLTLEETPAQKIDKSKLDKAAQRSRRAATALTTVANLPNETIPKELINRAKAVAVFPNLDKVNLVIEKAMQGYGVVCRRLPNGWSPPAYYGFGMAEVGITSLGTAKPDIIMLFMNDKALEAFEKGRIRLKGDMLGFAGPVGELTRAMENDILAANVIVYLFQAGKVKGIKVNAGFPGDAAIDPDNNINKSIYGLKGQDVLSGKAPLLPSILPMVSEFQNALITLTKQ